MPIRFRFSLRVLLVLMLLLGILLVPFVMRLNEARRQKANVERVVNMGGTVHYFFEREPDPPPPTWLRDLLGNHFFVKVRHVQLTYCNASDETIAPVSEFPHLASLDVLNTQVTTEGLASILPRKGLKRLMFGRQGHDTALPGDGDGLDRLGDVTSLERLHLINPPLGESGISFVSRLRNLESLNLSGGPLRNEDFRHIRDLHRLTDVRLANMPIDDDRLRHLAGLANLKTLCLDSTHIEGTGLVHLKQIPQLESLSLHSTPVNDDAVHHLRELKTLKVLGLRKTSVTAKAINRLQGALPNCRIEN